MSFSFRNLSAYSINPETVIYYLFICGTNGCPQIFEDKPTYKAYSLENTGSPKQGGRGGISSTKVLC